MDGNVGSDVEAQFYFAANDVEHRDFEQPLEASGASDDHGFPAFSRQDQHGRISIFMAKLPGILPIHDSLLAVTETKKKPAWSNTFWYSTTPAYSSNWPPGLAGLPFS
jgi:hypothetical protein